MGLPAEPISRDADDRISPATQDGRVGIVKLCSAGCLLGISAALLWFAASNTFSGGVADGAVACHMNIGSHDASGRIERLLSPAQAAANQLYSDADIGAPMSPQYTHYTLAKVLVMKANETHFRGVRIPPGTSVKAGDYIDFAAGRRDPTSSCSYIPNLLIRVRAPQTSFYDPPNSK